MTKINLDTVAKIIAEVGKEQIVPRFQKLAAHDVEMKGKDDPVTVADKEAERCLTEQFTAYLPNSVVVGEESFAKDPSIMSHLDNDHPVWIIDPIDGTRNFVAGKPEFATMVALVVKRQPIASWIHDPITGDTIMAEKGAGVWLGGEKVKLAANDLGGDTVGLVGARVKKLLADEKIMPEGGNTPKIEIGSCAGFDYPRLFVGKHNFANSPKAKASFLLYRHTNAWDHMPGLFLHQEGGGYSADWSGQPYNMDNARSGLLFAPNKDAWEELLQIFTPLMHYTTEKAPNQRMFNG